MSVISILNVFKEALNRKRFNKLSIGSPYTSMSRLTASISNTGEFSKIGNYNHIRYEDWIENRVCYTSVNITMINDNNNATAPADRMIMRMIDSESDKKFWKHTKYIPNAKVENDLIEEYVRICKDGDGYIIITGSVETINYSSDCIGVGNPTRIVKENIEVTTPCKFID